MANGGARRTSEEDARRRRHARGNVVSSASPREIIDSQRGNDVVNTTLRQSHRPRRPLFLPVLPLLSSRSSSSLSSFSTSFASFPRIQFRVVFSDRGSAAQSGKIHASGQAPIYGPRNTAEQRAMLRANCSCLLKLC